MNRTEYHDQYGFLHHQRTSSAGALTSENGPLYTGMELVLKFMNGKASPTDARNFFASLSHLHGKHQKGFWSWVQRRLGWDWQATPVSDRYDFSKDNWFGVWMALVLIRKHYRGIYLEHKNIVNAIPVLHKQILTSSIFNPTPFMIVAKAKYGWKLFDKFIKKDFMRAAKETHKTRGGRKIAKTDMKMMAWCLSYAFDFDPAFTQEFSNVTLMTDRKKPLPVNNKVVPLNKQQGLWIWGAWYAVFLDYFPDYSHPLVLQVKKISKVIL